MWFGECPLTGWLVCHDGCRFRACDGLVLSHDCELCFCSYGVLSSICIPDHVHELCDDCFKECNSLRRVTFGSSSSLERNGVSCFERTGVKEVSIPNSVRELCDHCFFWCESLRCVMFGSSSSLERIGAQCFTGCVLQISVLELCNKDSSIWGFVETRKL